MSIIRFIGDVHGKYGRYETLLNDSPYRTHQIGDMGVGFRRYPHGNWQANPPYDLMVEKGATFHRGNHDNPEVCKRHTQYIVDGTVYDGMMFIGGALSIDKAYRIEDYSWWPDEELSPDELAGMFVIYDAARPAIMVTHECPERIAAMIVGNMPKIDGGTWKMDERFRSRTRQSFCAMFAIHQPKLWIFGHWHTPFDVEVDGTRFICLPELAFMDIDTETAAPIGDMTPQREKW